MLNITMAKKGIGTVIFSQRNTGEMVDITTIGGVTFTVAPNDANGIYKEYIANGFTVKVTPEKKVASPKKTAPKPKKTREESLTEKYGTKEERKAYMKAKNDFTGFYRRKLCGKVAFNDFHKAVEQCVKNALDQWDANGRPSYEC